MGEALDHSSNLIHQQQGAYATTSSRAGLAFRIDREAGVASSEALVALGRALVPASGPKPGGYPKFGPGNFGECERRKVWAALEQINADGYSSWVTTCACLVALAQHLGDEALSRWLSFCAQGGEEARRNNDHSSTNPEVMFHRMTPAMGAEAAMGSLMSLAKADALRAAEQEIRAKTLTERGSSAIQYLMRYHPAALEQLFSACEVQL